MVVPLICDVGYLIVDKTFKPWSNMLCITCIILIMT